MRRFTIHYVCTDGCSVHRERFWGNPCDLQKHAEAMLKELSLPEMWFVRFYYTEVIEAAGLDPTHSEPKSFVVVYKNLPEFKGMDEFAASAGFGGRRVLNPCQSLFFTTHNRLDAIRFTSAAAVKFALEHSWLDGWHGSAEIENAEG